MQELIERSQDPAAPYAVSKVFSDKPDAPGLRAARDLGVPAQAFAPSRTGDRALFDRELAAAIGDCAPSLVALAGFMRILSPQFVQMFAGRILNIHPSLLPKFPGLHTHRRALEAGDAEHGATVHFVTEQLDGGPRIVQARIAVAAEDDEHSLAKRVLAQEHRIYPMAVRWYCEGRLRYREGQAWLDGKVLEAPQQFGDVDQ